MGPPGDMLLNFKGLSEGAMRFPWRVPVLLGWSLDIQIFNVVVPTLGQSQWQTYGSILPWLLSPMELSFFCGMKASLFLLSFMLWIGWREEKLGKIIYIHKKKVAVMLFLSCMWKIVFIVSSFQSIPPSPVSTNTDVLDLMVRVTNIPRTTKVKAKSQTVLEINYRTMLAPTLYSRGEPQRAGFG